ncbi:hypothetical protein A0H81_02080 [Grifola frondosa]|uniref:DUF6535 domain-containing protein n=1 Tax=Grifola frondosa TaxID=5627 RepID=A0A1C7MKE7_GRIFR|nr:hypothetical protein A0H81_02080 [Grifola frondosa]
MVSERPVTTSRRGGVRSDTAQSLRDEHSQGAPENTTVEIYRGRAPQDAASNFHDQSYRPEVPQVDMWKLYLDPALREDKESVQQWNSDLDSLLLFAALFSAVLTAFIIESYKNLSMDSGNASVELLQAILVTLQANGSAPSSSFAAPDISHFAPTGSAIRVNIYWFASLIISLSTALIAILAKQWLNYLLAGLSPVPSVQGRQRQYRMDGMLKWKLPDLLSFLPALLHIALLLFFAGLVDFVWYINRSVALVSFVLVVAAFLVYSSTIVLSCLYPDCPFKTSVTVLLSVIHQHLRFIYKQLLVGFGMLEDLLQVIRKHCGLWFRLRRHVKGRSLTHAIAEVWRNRNAQVKALNDNPGVHFSALKSKDEEVVSQNSSILDTRSLIWLIHNSARLVDSQKLVHAIISFPHIVSHRQLLVDGGTALFLEKLVLDWYTTGDQLINLSKDPVRYSDFVHCIGVLGALVCEAEATDEAYATKAIVGTSGLEDVPFLSITSSQNTAIIPASLDAGPCSFALVYQLFSEFEQLPLLVASYTLRLTARLAEPNAEWIWKHFGDKQIHERFFAKILQADWRAMPKRDLHAAVTTMIHLALCDTIRNQRDSRTHCGRDRRYTWLVCPNR